MKNNVKLLDCTLRDGGYVNDWRFGNLTIRSILSRLDSAGIDIIEAGFLDSRVEYDENRSIYPDIPSIAKTLGACIPKNAEIVAMIDFGTFDADLLLPKDKGPYRRYTADISKGKSSAGYRICQENKGARI